MGTSKVGSTDGGVGASCGSAERGKTSSEVESMKAFIILTLPSCPRLDLMPRIDGRSSGWTSGRGGCLLLFLSSRHRAPSRPDLRWLFRCRWLGFGRWSIPRWSGWSGWSSWTSGAAGWHSRFPALSVLQSQVRFCKLTILVRIRRQVHTWISL